MIVDISKVKENPNNPRVIRDEKFKKLVKSIREFPEMLAVRKLVCTPDMVVLGGNMRLRALREAKVRQVDIDIVEWDLDKQKRFIIADNVSFGEWNHEELANEWDVEELGAWGLDIPELEDVTELEATQDDYETPNEIQTDIVLGDLIEIGPHRLLCGDSTDSDQVAKLMNGEKADMVFTDPPYGVGYQSNMRVKSKKFDVLKNDDVFITDWINNLPIFSNGFVFVWTSWKVVKEWIGFLEPLGDLTNMVIWDKGGGGIGDLKGTFASDFEIGLVYNRNAQIIGKRLGSVWNVNKDQATTYLHPTQKPVGLALLAIENILHKNKIVLDLFLGSGSTMVAAHQLKRKCYGMELDPKYCQVIIDRMMKLDDGLQVKINGKEYNGLNSDKRAIK